MMLQTPTDLHILYCPRYLLNKHFYLKHAWCFPVGLQLLQVILFVHSFAVVAVKRQKRVNKMHLQLSPSLQTPKYSAYNQIW